MSTLYVNNISPTSGGDVTVSGSNGLTISGSLKIGNTTITATAAEINILDGGNTSVTTTIVDADRLILNDGGVMKQVSIDNFAAYFENEISGAVTATTISASSTLQVVGEAELSSNLGVTGSVTAGTNFTVGSLVVSDDQIQMTPSSGDTATIAASANGALTITTVDAAAAAANVGFVVDGAFDIDAAGAVTIDGSAITIGGDSDVAIDIDSSTLDIDASGAITMDSTSTIVISGDAGATLSDDTEALAYDGSGNVDFDAVALDIDASGAITIDGASTLSIDSVDDSNLTVTASGKDLDIAVAGGGAQELRLASAGTGAAAIHLNASAGGIDIDSADMIDIDAADEITIDTTSADGHIAVTSAHTAGQSILISANADAGSILDIDAGILDVDIQAAATLDAVGIALGAGSGELDLTTTGTLDINANAMDMDLTDSSSITITSSEAAEDLTIEQVGANDSSIIIQAAGTGTDAIRLNASAGGVDVDAAAAVNIHGATGAAFGDDTEAIAYDGSGNLDLDAVALDVDTSGAISINAAGAASDIEIITAHTAGTAFHLDANANAGSIVDIDAGILDIDVTGATTIDATSVTTTAATQSIAASTSLGITSPAVTIDSSSDGKPVLTIKTTHTTKTSSGELQFLKDAADTEDGEVLGQITFFGEDEGNNNTAFAKIVASISESDEGDEAGKLELFVAESDSTTTALTAGLVLEGEHATDGEIDVTIGAGTASTTTIAGNMTVTSDLTLNGGDGALTFNSAGENSIKIPDNNGSALIVEEANNVYMKFVTTDGQEHIQIPDDTILAFGSDTDVTVQYDEDGDDAFVVDLGAGSSGGMQISSAASANAVLTIKNTENNVNGSTLKLVNDRAHGNISDGNEICGSLEFLADDTDGNITTYASVVGSAADSTSGSEEGILQFKVAENDGTLNAGLVITGTSTNDRIDVTLASDLASVTTVNGGLTTKGAMIAGDNGSATNLADDAAIPINVACARVDANGGARTGIRFNGSGTIGQILVVVNVGGENLTFHATEGTAVLRGTNVNKDTILPGEAHIFVSDGTLWNHVGGGKTDEQMTAG